MKDNVILGDVVSFGMFGKRMVVLNSPQAVTELLEKRGTIYSERDHNVMIQDLFVHSLRASKVILIPLHAKPRNWRR